MCVSYHAVPSCPICANNPKRDQCEREIKAPITRYPGFRLRGRSITPSTTTAHATTELRSKLARRAALLALTTTLIAASPMRRQSDLASAVLSDIATLSTDLSTLTSEVNSFDGGLLASLGVITAETALDAQILKTTATVKHSASFNNTEGQSIVLALAGLVTPITDSLTAISDKYETFKRAFESLIVLFDLKVLKAHTDDLVSALKEKVPAADANLLDSGSSIIDKAFNSTIAIYEGQ